MRAMQIIGWMFICFIAFVFLTFMIMIAANIVRYFREQAYIARKQREYEEKKRDDETGSTKI